ncbi:MAG: hypothetical protein IPN87_07155 [Saprospiraceae bacterium]|nr:hypothetical protein [Candidatus Brachybacter algidus]
MSKGDDWRSVNWLPLRKSNQLMALINIWKKGCNQFVIMEIAGRVMKMPINGLNLLDRSQDCCTNN